MPLPCPWGSINFFLSSFHWWFLCLQSWADTGSAGNQEIHEPVFCPAAGGGGENRSKSKSSFSALSARCDNEALKENQALPLVRRRPEAKNRKWVGGKKREREWFIEGKKKKKKSLMKLEAVLWCSAQCAIWRNWQIICSKSVQGLRRLHAWSNGQMICGENYVSSLAHSSTCKQLM